MKKVGVKIENKGTYKYFYSLYEVNKHIESLLENLKEDEAVEIKVGNNRYYIDYDNKDWDNHYEYYVKRGYIMKFKNNKCISISKVEYEDVQFLWSISSCLADHIEKVAEAFKLDYNKAYNLCQAVRNNYKYMKIE